MCQSEEEVRSFGGTTEWKQAQQSGCPWFQRFTTGLMLIQAPEGYPEEQVNQYFPYTLGGVQWALAAMSFKGTAYTAVVKPLKTARRFGYLRLGYHTALHGMSSKLKQYKTGRTGYVPVVKTIPVQLTDDFFAELTGLMESFTGGDDE